MQRLQPSRERKLPERFRSAFRGVDRGLRSERNFVVHFAIAAAVIAAAAVLGASFWEWSILLVCVGVVLGAEMFNTAVEELAKAISREHNEHIRDALDISSGAVLLAAGTASLVGLVVFAHRLGVLLAWWPN